MKKTRLKTLSGETEINVPAGIKGLKDFTDPESTILLVDSNVLLNYSELLEGFPLIDVGEGEQAKTIENSAAIIGKLIENEVDRSFFLVGIGGGITTDLAGFVASVYLRGIPFGFISTTLLGQVDAAVGGKNGVNYQGYKNMVGLIRQPHFVNCDIESLRTLPKDEFTGGFAEIIKYAAIKRGDLFPYLQENINKALNYDEEVLENLIYESILTKVQVVESDEQEQGDRKLLNFGHTFGHALEKLYMIPHGQAVSVGMVLAARLSVNKGKLKPDKADQLQELIFKTGLPVSFQMDTFAMAEAMKKDKKRRGKNISFIVLEDIGKSVIHDIPVNDLKSVFDDLY